MAEAVTTEPIVREVRIAASPETIFGFFTEPEKLTRWMCEAATTDPRPGGALHLQHRGASGDRAGREFHARGEFVEVDFPTRVVFTWGWEESEFDTPPGSSTVEVTLEPQGEATLVRLVHRDLSPAAAADHDGGWARLLEQLAAVAAS
jgi:uncharacterized protein YndB with AHSA1/START domain